MQNKKIGYVAIQFTPETNQEIIAWSQSIKKEDLVTAIIDGGTEGGNVTDKLHLTLFYGFNDELLNKVELSKFINKIKLREIKIRGLGFFPVGNHNCDVLHLQIKDDNGELRKIHEELKAFPHFSEDQKFEYTPHVTIAYVKKNFNLNTLIQNQPEMLRVRKTSYILS